MSWDLNDKYLALSLWHDHELTPAERAQVDARLATDTDWRETYNALLETERKLAATLMKNLQQTQAAAGVAADGPVDLALARILALHRLDPYTFPAELTAQAFPSAAERTLAGLLSAHRLDAAGFPAEVAAQAFASVADRWLARVLTAHRLDQQFVRRVTDAIQIAGFQEPLDAQLKDAFRAHRVGTGFVEKILSGAQAQTAQTAQASPTPVTGPIADVPVVPIAEAAAQQPAAPMRRRTPNRPLTPAQGSARMAAGSRVSSGRRAPLTSAAVPVSAATQSKPSISLLRWAPYAAAAALLLALGLIYFYHAAVPTTGQNHPLVASHLHVTVYKRAAKTSTGNRSAAVAATAPGGLPGYVFDKEMEPAAQSIHSGTNAGELLLLSDAENHQLIARVILDANTSVAWADSSATAPRGVLTLTEGGLLADVEKGGQNFVILTQDHKPAGMKASDGWLGSPEAIVVHGTRFFVHAEGSKTSVDVLEGLVSYQPGRSNASLTPAPPLPPVSLPSGARYSRDANSGAAKMQRADPCDIFYAFAPRELAISAWPQAGGGLERGGADLTAWRDEQPLQSASVDGAEMLGQPVVAANGQFMGCRENGDQVELGFMTIAPGDAAAPAAPAAPADHPAMQARFQRIARFSGRYIAGPVVLPRGPIALALDHHVEAVTADGLAAWRIDLPADTDLYAISAGPRGRLILSTSQGLSAYDGATGSRIWENRDLGEITTGIAATERADQPFILAYDSIHARLHKLDADGGLLKTLDFRAADAAPTTQALARDIKDWTVYETPILVGDNCVLVFEDGATALVNLTTGASRMTAGFGSDQRVRYAALNRASLLVTVVLQSNAAWQCDLNGTAAAPKPAASANNDIAALAVSGDTALRLTADGKMRLCTRPPVDAQEK